MKTSRGKMNYKEWKEENDYLLEEAFEEMCKDEYKRQTQEEKCQVPN